MAKKKVSKPKEEEEDLDEFDDDSIEDKEFEIALPKIDKKPAEDKEEPTPSAAVFPEISELEEEEELEFELEEEPEGPSYKHLSLEIKRTSKENDYELIIEGQSHGFCNILVKHLLDVEGVNIAAYKVTRIELPKIFIRLENGYKIKDIIIKGIDTLREEVLKVQKLFQKIK